MAWNAVKRGFRLSPASWKTIWIPERCVTRANFRAGMPPNLGAIESDAAATGSMRCATSRTRVDLLPPDSPTRPSVSPGPIENPRYPLHGASFGVRDARNGAPRFTGKCLVRLRIWRTGSVIRAASKRLRVIGLVAAMIQLNMSRPTASVPRQTAPQGRPSRRWRADCSVAPLQSSLDPPDRRRAATAMP
jgi:hypothetical protein